MERCEYENMKNNRLLASNVGGNRYSPTPSNRSTYMPTPSAPKLEVTINQNVSDISPTNSYSRIPGNPSYSRIPTAPPSYAPPRPPSNKSEYAVPMWIDRFPKRENKGMFRVALVEALLSAVVLGLGLWCYFDTPDYCPYYSAIWTSVCFLLNAIVGSIAAKIGAINLYIAHLVLSLICMMMCAVSAFISARNWILVGTYDHPRIDRNHAFCLIGELDAPRVSYIFSQLENYDFKACLFQLKVGVAVNSVQFVIAGIIAILNFLSVFLCCKRICTSCFKK